jgi:type II secretory pathway component PulF
MLALWHRYCNKLGMKTFEFIAFDSSGKKKVGTINAWKLSEAKRKIQQKGFYLASIKIQDGSVGSGIAITREGNQENQNPFSFFKELKRFFFSDGKVGV